MYQPIDWLYEHRNSNLDVDIHYFSLELSKQAKIRQAMSYRLFTKYGIVISPQDLRSVFSNYILDDEVEEFIEAEQEWFKFFEEKVHFYDNVRNPYGIYTTMRHHFESNGSYDYKTLSIINKFGKPEDVKARDKYIPNNPDIITVVLLDHASLLLPEKEDNGSLYNALGRYSSRFCLELRDMYKAQVVTVQQQAAATEQMKYTMIGGTILDKVKPTADGLGDNKSSARDANLLITLFDPYRYKQKEYNGIDLKQMKGSYRELFINLNRDGISNASIDLYFNGACNYFEEIPSKSSQQLENYYGRINKFSERKKST